jgi:hypothetical protein
MLVNWWMSHSPKPAPAEPPGAGTRPVKRVGRSGAVVVHPDHDPIRARPAPGRDAQTC